MDLREYQLEAAKTDAVPRKTPPGQPPEGKEILIPLFGLAGEVGTLLAEFKKHLRDGKAHLMFKEQVAEELGDLLWYVADVATKFELDLGEVGAANLKKTQARWPHGKIESRQLFDEDCPPHEQLPRQFSVLIREELVGEKLMVRCWMGAEGVGDPLTDNAWEDDGYRFHDVFHLAHMTILGWSPIMRSLLKRKRKSMPEVDEIEDGARAKVVEEAIAAIVYDYARKHDFLEGVHTLDYPLLKTIQGLVSDREVRACSLHEWQMAILAGYHVWRKVWRNRGGIVVGDLPGRILEYKSDLESSVR
jgi:NTP pyrophosphatase (non-canonical NTP hydrolase)